jgi:hypothetical protein
LNEVCRQLEPNNEQEEINISTYQNIIKCISGFKSCLRRFDITCLTEEYMEYKILEHRAYPTTFANPGNLTTIKKEIMILIQSANDSNRNNARLAYRQQNKNYPPSR